MRMNINCDEISQELRVMINLNIKFDEIKSFDRGRMDIELKIQNGLQLEFIMNSVEYKFIFVISKMIFFFFISSK